MVHATESSLEACFEPTAPKCSPVPRWGAEVQGERSCTENMLSPSFPTQASISPQPGSSRVSRPGSLHRSTAPSEEKKPETAVSRLQRREQLKKANTLPTSVTGRALACNYCFYFLPQRLRHHRAQALCRPSLIHRPQGIPQLSVGGRKTFPVSCL